MHIDSEPTACTDLIDCSAYGLDDCNDYALYMTKNCPLFCGVCGTRTREYLSLRFKIIINIL